MLKGHTSYARPYKSQPLVGQESLVSSVYRSRSHSFPRQGRPRANPVEDPEQPEPQVKEQGERLSSGSLDKSLEERTGDSEEWRKGGSEEGGEEVNLKRSEEIRRGSSEERKRENSDEGMRGSSEKGMRGNSQKGSRGSSEKVMKGSSEKGMRGSSERGMRGSSEKGIRGSSEKGMKGSSEKGTRGSSEKGMRGSSEKGIKENSKEGERGSSEERRRVAEKYSKTETFYTARVETKLIPHVSEAKAPAQDKRANKSQKISNCFVKTGKETDVLISPLESETLSPMGELSTIAKKYFPRVNRQLFEKTKQKTDARTCQHLQSKSSYKPKYPFLQTLV